MRSQRRRIRHVGVARGVQDLLQGIHGRGADRVADAGPVHGHDRDAIVAVQRYLGHLILLSDIGILIFSK
jgi:hypothetical protein